MTKHYAIIRLKWGAVDSMSNELNEALVLLDDAASEFSSYEIDRKLHSDDDEIVLLAAQLREK